MFRCQRPFLAVLVISLLTFASIQATSSLSPPSNIRLTNIFELNNEQQVFICPTDSNVIIANWRDFRLGYRQVGIGRTTDGGLTWTDSLINPNMQYYVTDSKQSDPTMAVDRFGNFYMSVLDYIPGLDGASTISFYKSTDKGVSWTGPFENVQPFSGVYFEDKQFITVDNTGGPHDGNVYISWTRFPNPDRIVFQRSIDGGINFQDTVIVGPIQTSTGCGTSQIDAGQFSIPVVSSNGDVHVFWQGYSLDSAASCTGTLGIKHVSSTDGGQTFGAEDLVLPVSGYTNASGGIQTYSQPVAMADITGGPFDGNLYIAFTNQGPEDGVYTDVDVIRSSDNAATWSSRVQVNDSPNSSNFDAFHPWLIVNEEGVLIVIFYDNRFDDPTFNLFDLLAAYSFDGGETFTTNHRITSTSSSPGGLKDSGDPAFTVDANGFPAPVIMASRAGLLGEYIGVTAFHDKVNAVWTDSRHGNSECYTANWYIPTLEPRLLAPDSGVFVTAVPNFHWSTSWKNNQDRYRLELSDDELFGGAIVERVLDTNILVFDSTLSDGAFYWRVKTLRIDGTDSSAYSEVRRFEVDATAPQQPSLLAPIDGTETGNPTPFFDWSPVTKAASAVSYDLEISTNVAFPVTPETVVYPDLLASEFQPVVGLTPDTTSYWRVRAKDEAGNATLSSVYSVAYRDFICGDINQDGSVDISDLTFLVNYAFRNGPTPPLELAADVDSSGDINIADVTRWVDFSFKAGPPLSCP